MMGRIFSFAGVFGIFFSNKIQEKKAFKLPIKYIQYLLMFTPLIQETLLTEVAT